MWTFYQFLGGVFKHRSEGPMPYTYDFQDLHRRMEELIPKIGVDGGDDAVHELDQMERELDRVQRELARIESGFPPSLLRRFFDHIKRQDEKVLCALLKFYLQSGHFEQDTLDKLDILFTRLAEAPLEDGRVTHRDPNELLDNFGHLNDFSDLPPLPAAEEAPLVEAVRDIRRELETIEDYPALVVSKLYERYRRLKQRFGRAILHPPILVEVTATNIMAKNRFKELYEAEENKVLENTNRIYDIERYLERHPELANDDLRQQIETFRRVRVRYDASRREDNVKRDDIAEMAHAMETVLVQFDPSSKRPVSPTERRLDLELTNPVETPESPDAEEVGRSSEDPRENARDEMAIDTSLSDVLPTDPLLNEALHKIMFALEMVVWDHLPERVGEAPEIMDLKLEPWEIVTYRKLADREVQEGTADWEMERFFLTSAALRVKMDDECKEITRLDEANNPDRLFEVLERSAQSLERAREVDRRFQWFVDDVLFRGETEKLEHIYRSRFRFLHAYSGLWLSHQRSGGLTPL
ncbi:MAG: hypothetical protein ACC742_00775 [Thermoanaerobaculales bacterium]